MKKPEAPEHMNGDHQHLREMIEWHRAETRGEFGRIYWLFGGVFLAVSALIGMVASLLIQL